MLTQGLKTLFPRTDRDSGKIGIEVVHFDADDSPTRRSVMSMDYLLAPLASENLSREQGRG